jgi:hypothetical protein
MESTVGAFTLLFLGGAVLVIVWIVLPFAVFGIKPLLRELIQEQRNTQHLLRQMEGGPDAPARPNAGDTVPGSQYRGAPRRDYPPN